MKLQELLNENTYNYNSLPKYDGGMRQAKADFRGNQPSVVKMKIPAGIKIHGTTELMDLAEFPDKKSFLSYYKVVKKQGGQIEVIK